MMNRQANRLKGNFCYYYNNQIVADDRRAVKAIKLIIWIFALILNNSKVFLHAKDCNIVKLDEPRYSKNNFKYAQAIWVPTIPLPVCHQNESTNCGETGFLTDTLNTNAVQ